LTLIDTGIATERNVFPRELFEDYLRGAPRATSDEQRLALDRYLRILDRLRAADLSLVQPGVERFTLAMRDCLTTKRERLAAGVTEVDRLLREHQSGDGKTSAKAIDRALAEWTDKVVNAE
jgi:hypothetical protein